MKKGCHTTALKAKPASPFHFIGIVVLFMIQGDKGSLLALGPNPAPRQGAIVKIVTLAHRPRPKECGVTVGVPREHKSHGLLCYKAELHGFVAEISEMGMKKQILLKKKFIRV